MRTMFDGDGIVQFLVVASVNRDPTTMSGSAAATRSAIGPLAIHGLQSDIVPRYSS